jgi:hypothetical protein
MSLKNATKGRCPRAVPNEFALDREMCLTSVVANQYTFINAVPISGYLPGNRITLNLPQEFVSLQDAYLEFNVVGSLGNTGGGMTGQFIPDIRSIIQRMTILFGSKTILDIQEWGMLQNIFDYTFDPLWAQTTGRVLVATNDSVAERAAFFSSTTQTYACRLNFSKGLESIYNKVIPFQKVGSTMQIQLYLQSDPSRVISTSITPTGSILPSFTVNNVEFHYITNVPTPEWNADFDQKIVNNNFGGGVTFTCRGYDWTQDTSLLPAGVTFASKTLTFKYASLLGLIIAFQPSAVPTTWTQDTKMQYFYNPALNLLRVRIGGQQFPQDSSTNDADTYGRFLLMFGLDAESPYAAASAPQSTGNTWSYVSGSYPTYASFVPTCPLMKYPNQIRSDDRIANEGLDTSIATSIQLDLGFSVAIPSGGLVTNIFAIYEYTMILNPNGSVTLYN